MDLETKYKKMKLSFDLMEKTAIKAMDVLADYHFNPEEVEEKTLRNARYHISEYLKEKERMQDLAEIDSIQKRTDDILMKYELSGYEQP